MEFPTQPGNFLREKLRKVGEAMLNSHFMQAFLSNTEDRSPDAFKATVEEIMQNLKNKKER